MRISALLLALFISSTLLAHEYKEVSLEKRIDNASVVVEGKVLQSESFWDASKQNIYTAHSIEVYKIFKGELNATTISLITPGGTVGLTREEVSGSLQIYPGQTGVFFLKSSTVKRAKSKKSGVNEFQPYSGPQGFVKYSKNEAVANDIFNVYPNIKKDLYQRITNRTTQKFKRIQAYDPDDTQFKLKSGGSHSISSFSPDTVSAGTKTILTITGLGFGVSGPDASNYVEFRDADDGGSSYVQPLATEYISWADGQIQVEVTKPAGTGTFRVVVGGSAVSSATALTVLFAELNATFDPGSGSERYMTAHVDDNTAGGYTWQMHTDFDGDADAKSSFTRALDSWRCNTSVNWTIGSTTAVDATASDGINIIRFDNGAELPEGVLGRCTSRWSGCFVDGDSLQWYVNELDITFNDGFTWNYGPDEPAGGEYDFESVALHELGHGHQLGHVIDPGAVMHYAISSGTSNRTLSELTDLAGGQDVHSRSTTIASCGQSVMTNYMGCSNPPIADFSGTPTIICAGQTVNFTDLSIQSPTSWSWTFTGGTPASSTDQHPQNIQYNTPGTYAVALEATNSSGSDSETKVAYITVYDCATQLQTAYCNSTLGQMFDYIWSDAVAGASKYRFLIEDGGDPVDSVNGYLTHNFASLSWANGIDYNTTYDISVKARVNGVWGDYGVVCQVSTPALAPTTKVIDSQCGTTLSAMSEYVRCDLVGGAERYRFQVSHGPSGFLDSVNNYVGTDFTKLSLIDGMEYGLTYDVSVKTRINGVWGNLGPVCQITMPNAPQTQLIASQCGETLNSLSEYMRCEMVPGADNYRFLVTDGVDFTDSINGYAGNSFTSLTFIEGIAFGTTYDVRVKYRINGEWSAYGPICQLTTPDEPFTQLIASQCGTSLGTLNEYLRAEMIPGADKYRFHVTDGVDFTDSINSYSTTNFTSLAWMDGIQYETSYDVRVKYRRDGVWSPYGVLCQVTTPSAPGAPLMSPPGSFEEAVSQKALHGASHINFSLFPNPGDGKLLNITIHGLPESTQQLRIDILNIAGQLIQSKLILANNSFGNYSLTLEEGLPQGVYLIGVEDKPGSRQWARWIVR